jgi:hypothetical protein
VTCACGRIAFDDVSLGDGGGDGVIDAAACTAVAARDWLPVAAPRDAARAYTVSADGMEVRDQVTGLAWQRDPAPMTMPQNEAAAYCAGLTLGGCAHWRLPQRIELATLVAHPNPSPVIDPSAFPNTPTDTDYWTATPNTAASNTWEQSFGNGNVSWNANTFAYHVRCVRDGLVGVPPPARYTISASTVRDVSTGLTWAAAIDPVTETADNAIVFCANLATDGGGWRLPEIAELETLVDTSRASPAIDPTAFPGTPSTQFWSRSAYLTQTNMLLDFTGGSVINGLTSTLHQVRCVR